MSRCDLEKSYELTLHLEDGDDEDLIRKNKKKKTLGYIVVRLVLSPLTKEEYNEVRKFAPLSTSSSVCFSSFSNFSLDVPLLHRKAKKILKP